MSENVNFCFKFVYEFISNHFQVKFIDSCEYEVPIIFLPTNLFLVYRIKNSNIKIFFFGGGGGGGLGSPGPPVVTALLRRK